MERGWLIAICATAAEWCLAFANPVEAMVGFHETTCAIRRRQYNESVDDYPVGPDIRYRNFGLRLLALKNAP